MDKFISTSKLLYSCIAVRMREHRFYMFALLHSVDTTYLSDILIVGANCEETAASNVSSDSSRNGVPH